MKKVLLIGGGGTLGTYTAEELLRLGCAVDVLCPEEKASDIAKLRFLRAYATIEYLQELFQSVRYDGIVNFLHYKQAELYKPFHELLCANTEHLIFLSSYRIYADLQHPITESAPQLLDVSTDAEFLAEESYALAKSRCERYLFSQSQTNNWTAVRPVISFSQYRFDIVVSGKYDVLEHFARGEEMLLPAACRDLTAGLDWAGNTGKIIARLLLRDGTQRQAYTVSSAQNRTWGEVADFYTNVVGTKFRWVDTETYLQHDEQIAKKRWILLYDRLYDRTIDNRKVLQATGLTSADFLPVEEGLRIELEKYKQAWK